MTLENSKKIMFGQNSLFRILMAMIFISAGLFRVFNPVAAEGELIKLGLPVFFTWFILAIELGCGFFLLIGKFVKQMSLVFILFLGFALISALVNNGMNIIGRASELFVFDANPTDFFMHLVFLIILLFLFLKQSK